MSTLNKLRKTIQEEIKKVLNESDDPKSARNDAFELTKQARSVAGYDAKIPAYQKALAAHQKAASLMKSLADKKEHLLAAKKLQIDIERFKSDVRKNGGNMSLDTQKKLFPKSSDKFMRSDKRNESSRDDELKRLKIQNKDVDLNLTLAGVQGELAYENGKLRVPGEDKELMNNLDMAVGDIKNDSSEKSKYRKQLLQAWLDGYDAKKEDLESYDESWMEDPKDLDESELQEGDQNQGYKVGQKLLWVNRGNVMLCTYKGPEKTGWANVVVVAGDGIFSSRVTSSEIVNLDQLCSVDDADYIIRTNKSK